MIAFNRARTSCELLCRNNSAATPRAAIMRNTHISKLKDLVCVKGSAESYMTGFMTGSLLNGTQLLSVHRSLILPILFPGVPAAFRSVQDAGQIHPAPLVRSFKTILLSGWPLNQPSLFTGLDPTRFTRCTGSRSGSPTHSQHLP